MESDLPELESLFLKKMNGTLSLQEEKFLEEKFQYNQHIKQEFNTFQQIWNTAPSLPLCNKKSENERWLDLQQRLYPKPVSKLNSKYLVLKYAASLTVIAVLIGIFLYSNSTEIITIESKYGETKKITLPDQSTVVLNAETSLSYDNARWKKERKIILDGEALFHVQKNGAPFIVIASNSMVKVLGTIFNVHSRNQTTTVSCFEGKVNFGTADKSALLTKGMGAIVNGNELSNVFNLKDDKVRWISEALSFNNTPLREVFAVFERHFNVTISLKKDVSNLTFTGKFKDPTLQNAIGTVCLSAGLQYKIHNNDVTIE